MGRDWPLDYAGLEPYYRQAEHEIGVSADVADQAHLGVEFAPGYDYPMHRVPPSYSDQVLAAAVDGMQVTVGGEPVRGEDPQLSGGPQLDARAASTAPSAPSTSGRTARPRA